MNPNPRGEDRSADDELLDHLMGLDPDPQLSAAAIARIRSGLTVADDVALDALLALDEVEVPNGLADRVLSRSREEVASTRRKGLRPVGRRAAGVAVAAAAALLLWFVIRPDAKRESMPTDGDAHVASTEHGSASASQLATDEPTDELLAALPVLEEMGFLTEDLDPLELEALFLFDAEEDVLLNLALDAGLLEENG